MDQTPQPTPAPQPKPWANPTPAGLVALAVACFCFFALLTGNINRTPGTSNAMPLMGCWLLGGFAIQLVVALLDLKSGNAAGGNTFLYFSAFFMLVGGLEFLLKSLIPGLDTRVDGWAWLALTLVVWLWTPAFFKSPAMLTVVVLALGLALPFITLMDLKVFPEGFAKVGAPIAAWSLLVSGCSAIYLSAAMIVNGAYGKTILPNPGPLYKEKTEQLPKGVQKSV
jgi:hypothetical protein